jgi:hypothetical protein
VNGKDGKNQINLKRRSQKKQFFGAPENEKNLVLLLGKISESHGVTS